MHAYPFEPAKAYCAFEVKADMLRWSGDNTGMVIGGKKYVRRDRE